MKRAFSLAVVLSFLVFSFLVGACQRTESVTATYKVGGMDCDACAENIQTSVGEIEGVLSARVSYEEGEVEVTYDPGKLKPGAVEAAVKRMGYTAERQDP